MGWQSSYARSFEKDLLGLPADVQRRSIKVIEEIVENPFAGKKLQGKVNRYSRRIGRDYRVVYSVYKQEHLIDFEYIGARGEAYRWFRHE
jgi:mRNA-degrading endonuclease RelE of RelBE toxin-antitoxin system